MINTMASNRGTPLPLKKPVSSAYIVMLKRYLSRLHEEQSRNTKACPENHDKESLENVIPLERVSQIINEIESLCGYGSFGLDIGKFMHPSDYGIFGYAMMNCKTLMCALRTACEHKNVLNQEFFAEFFFEESQVIYQVNTDMNSKTLQILIELDFSTAFEFAQRLVGPDNVELPLSSVHFTHQPLGSVEHYLHHFKCPVYFGAPENQIRVNSDVLDTPIYGANPKVLSALEDKIVAMTRPPKKESSQFKDRVSLYVKTQLNVELPSAQHAASYFHMSLSAFKKRLHAEQSCYQNICDDVRYSRCLELMQKNSFAIKEIAFELGFTNASAFNRAFKRWAGESPSEFKKIFTREN